MLLWVFAACGATPAQDVKVYAALVGERNPDPDRDLPACARLTDPNLAGDCALTVAQRAANSRKVAPETWCGEVPAGTWRYECWFQAAETARRRGQEQKAAELCRESGPFINDCAQHLWQTRVHTLIRADGRRPDFVGRLGAAQAIYDEWAPLLGEHTDLESRFWSKYYQNGFESVGHVATAWCDGLPEAHHGRCLEAARDIVVRELAPNLDRHNAWASFCALSPATSANTSVWLRLDPSPELDAVVEERQRTLCAVTAPAASPGR